MPHQSNHPVTSTVTLAGHGAAAEVSEAEAGKYLAAFERLEAEIRAVPDDDLEAVINIDVQAAVTNCCGNMAELLALREEMAKLGGFDITLLDKLEDYASALGHTQTEYKSAVGSKDPATKLGQEVTAIRDLLFSDAAALAKRGYLEEKAVEALRAPSGYRNIAFDTLTLVGFSQARGGARRQDAGHRRRAQSRRAHDR